MSRYTPPGGGERATPMRRRPLYLRIGVIVLLVGVAALVLVDVLAAIL